MFYLPMYNVNSLEGLKTLCDEVIKQEWTIVEVGSFAGVSSDLLARYCKKLYCVDLWGLFPGIETDKMEQAEFMFDEVWKAHSNIEPIQGRASEIAKQFRDNSLDMVYIDGDHSYESVKEDILVWMPKVKQGGYIAGHDFILLSVQQAVKEILGEVKIYEDTSWAYQILT